MLTQWYYGIPERLMLDSSESQLFQVPGSEHVKLEQVVQGCVQYNIDCLQGWRVHRLWATCSVFNHSHNKKVFLFYLYGISAFQFVPVAFCPVTGCARHLGVLALSSLSPPVKYFSVRLRFLSETPPGWTVPALFVSPPWSIYCLCDSSLHLFQYVHMSPGVRSPGLDPALQECLTRAG